MTKKDILSVASNDKKFSSWLEFILDHEDVVRRDGTIITENVAGDSGGLTFAGIDKASHPHFPYSNPQPEDVVSAYKEDWDGVKGSELPAPVGFVVANFAVNMGRGEAIRLLQKAIGTTVDGDLGPETLKAAKSNGSPFLVSLAIISEADAHYKQLARNPRLEKFLAGWLNRDRDLKKSINV